MAALRCLFVTALLSLGQMYVRRRNQQSRKQRGAECSCRRELTMDTELAAARAPVVIRSSLSLAYCTIFIVMSSEVVDSHICICIRTSHCLYLCTHRLRAAAALPWPAAPQPTQFSGSVDLFSPVCYRMTRSHVTADVFKLGARFLETFNSDVVE